MKIKLLILTIFYLFFGASPAFAVTVTISNVPSNITEEPFAFNVSVSGAQSGTNYLRANFFPTGTTKYFGYTYNGSSFVNSSTCSDYLAIPIDSTGNWNGTVQAKIDTSSSYYSGAGTYSFKVRRYTQSCSSSYLWSNEVTTTVSISSSTPTPTPSPTLSPTPSPTASSPTSTSSFTISNTPSQINSDQSFSVNVNLDLQDKPNTSFYLKGAFRHPDKPTNYFGLTKVGSSWIKNSNSSSDQFPITTNSSGQWSENLEVQPDINDSGFIGSGDYLFKVARYENSNLTWSNNEVIIKITSVEVSDQGGTVLSTTSNNPSSTTTSPSTAPAVKNKASVSNQSKKYDGEVYRTATVAAATTSANSSVSAEVKSQQRINYFSWAGVLMIVGGTLVLTFVYLRNNNLREAISNLFRKRN